MDAESLKRITGKSISDFRRDLLAFGNQIITQTQKRIVRQSQAPLVKTVSAVLQRTGFRTETLINQTTPDNGNCCLKLKSAKDILIKFAGITPCGAVVDFTGINGDLVFASDPFGEFCFWGDLSGATVYGIAAVDQVPGDPSTRIERVIVGGVTCNSNDTLRVALGYNISTIFVPIFESGDIGFRFGPNTLIACPVENAVHFIDGTFVIEQ